MQEHGEKKMKIKAEKEEQIDKNKTNRPMNLPELFLWF